MQRFGRQERAVPTTERAAEASAPVRAEDVAADGRIEAYLDRVLAGLTRLPAPLRADTRRELRSHLTATRDALTELGETPEVAATAAIERFGDPATVARRYRRVWASLDAGEVRTVAADARGGFVACVLLFAVVCSLMSLPSDTGPVIRLLARPSGAVPLLLIGWFVVPAVIGARAGWRHPRRAAVRGVARAASLVGACAMSFVTLCNAAVMGYVLDHGLRPFSYINALMVVWLTILVVAVWTAAATAAATAASVAQERAARRRRA